MKATCCQGIHQTDKTCMYTHTSPVLSCQEAIDLHWAALPVFLPPESQNGNTELTTTFIHFNYPPCQCRPPSFLTNGISSPVLTFPFRSPQNIVIYFSRQHKKRAEVSCNLPQMQNIFGKLEERTVCNVSGGLNAPSAVESITHTCALLCRPTYCLWCRL